MPGIKQVSGNRAKFPKKVNIRDQSCKSKSQARVSTRMVYWLNVKMCECEYGERAVYLFLPFASSKGCRRSNLGLAARWLCYTIWSERSSHMVDQRVPSLESEGCSIHHQLHGKHAWGQATQQGATLSQE